MGENKVNNRLLLKTSFWYTLSNFLTHGISFITIPIFTRLMSKAEYGDFSVYSNWQQILAIICGVEVAATMNRARFDFQKKEEFDAYTTSSLFLSTVVTSSFLILYLLFPDFFGSWFLIKREYMMIMFAYLFTLPAVSVFLVRQRIGYKYKLSAAYTITVTVVSSLAALALVLVIQSDRILGRIIGQYTLPVIAGLVFYIAYLCKSRTIRKKYLQYALRMGLPLVFTYLASRILLTSDTIVLKHMCSAEEVSSLSVAHSAAQIIMLFVQALNIAWAPWLYDMLKIKEYKSIKKLYVLYLWGVTAFTLCILLVGPEVITVLGGEKYKDALYLLPPYILTGIFTAFTSPFGYLETYNKKPEISAVLTGIVAALNVGLDIVGVHFFGYQAVCYATVLCQILLIVLHYVFTKKYGIKEILQVGTLGSVLAAALALIPFSFLIYTNTAVRVGAIILFAIAVITAAAFNFKRIKSFLDKLLRSRRKDKDTTGGQT
ncbi:MAG: lipopolysaccharide biosynthesis protein [Clostridia bacterium]|nr:lipopolysaccharide biosynthesis protein [Clostridia bacterium]